MRVGVDQTGEEGHSRQFNDAGVLRRLRVGGGPSLLDLAAPNQDDPPLVGHGLGTVEDAGRLEEGRPRDRVRPEGQDGSGEERLHGGLVVAGTRGVPATIVTPPAATAVGTRPPSGARTRSPWSPRGARGRLPRTTGRAPSRRCSPRT